MFMRSVNVYMYISVLIQHPSKEYVRTCTYVQRCRGLSTKSCTIPIRIFIYVEAGPKFSCWICLAPVSNTETVTVEHGSCFGWSCSLSLLMQLLYLQLPKLRVLYFCVFMICICPVLMIAVWHLTCSRHFMKMSSRFNFTRTCLQY